MMQLWDRKHGRCVYTTCIHPHTRYKWKKSRMKVYSVADYEAKQELLGFGLTVAAVASWVVFIIAIIRWWNS